MPSSVYLHDGEKQITLRFPTEEDRERFKAHYRAIDALGVQFREERDKLRGEVAALRRGLEEWLGWDADEGRPGVPDRSGMIYRTQQLLKAVPADARGEGERIAMLESLLQEAYSYTPECTGIAEDIAELFPDIARPRDLPTRDSPPAGREGGD